jgi:hypothetical protein
MADLADEYFQDPDAVLDELDAELETRARTAQSEEGAEFDTIHRPDGSISRRGYVITEDDIVGVWAEFDELGANRETTFYAADNDGDNIRVEEFTRTDWSIPRIQDEARRWLRELREEEDSAAP